MDIQNSVSLTAVRQILLAVGSALVTKGYLDSGTLELVVGAVIAVGTAGWAIYTKKKTTAEIKSA